MGHDNAFAGSTCFWAILAAGTPRFWRSVTLGGLPLPCSCLAYTPWVSGGPMYLTGMPGHWFFVYIGCWLVLSIMFGPRRIRRLLLGREVPRCRRCRGRHGQRNGPITQARAAESPASRISATRRFLVRKRDARHVASLVQPGRERNRPLRRCPGGCHPGVAGGTWGACCPVVLWSTLFATWIGLRSSELAHKWRSGVIRSGVRLGREFQMAVALADFVDDPEYLLDLVRFQHPCIPFEARGQTILPP